LLRFKQNLLKPSVSEDEYSTRTDLAVEAMLASPQTRDVEHQREETAEAVISRVNIKSQQAAQSMGKLPGLYITIESPVLRQRNREAQQKVADLLAQELGRFVQLGENDPVFVVGLGNWQATPDALGPKVVEQLMVTRHLYNMVPPEVRGGLRPVSALAPGVLGLTGIETGEIVQGIVEKTKPKLVIAIDALASRSTSRLASTIQLSNSGIKPGSGVGNHRFGITKDSLGVDVIAIGVPTVVGAVTIASEAMEAITRPTPRQMPPGTTPLAVHEQQKQAALHRLLSPFMGSLMVTPKEVDVLIEDLSTTLASGLNAFLHPKLDLDNVLRYL
jgi:spore protease